MGLVKRTYVDGETVITAENLNAIQDAIIANEEAIEDQGEAIEGKYAKPSGGIPSTDLASAVQTSLEKANTALQSSDIDSTLTVTEKAADAKKTGDEISYLRNTLNQLESEIGIVVDGKSCALGASQGQYVILKNSTISGLSDGLYTAAQAIPAGEQNVTVSMLTGPISGGGLNSIQNSFKNLSPSFTSNVVTNSSQMKATQVGDIVSFVASITANGNVVVAGELITGLPSQFNINNAPIYARDNDSGAVDYYFFLLSSGKVVAAKQLTNGHSYRFVFTYVV